MTAAVIGGDVVGSRLQTALRSVGFICNQEGSYTQQDVNTMEM